MIVLRFSPVSSGLFSFRMSNTRSAGQAHSYQQYADTDSWPILSQLFLLQTLTSKTWLHLCVISCAKPSQNQLESITTKSDIQLYLCIRADCQYLYTIRCRGEDSREADMQGLKSKQVHMTAHIIKPLLGGLPSNSSYE